MQNLQEQQSRLLSLIASNTALIDVLGELTNNVQDGKVAESTSA